MDSDSPTWWHRTKGLLGLHVRPAPAWKAPPAVKPSGDALLDRFQMCGRWDVTSGTWRLDKFFNELSSVDIQRLAFERTRDGHNLATLVTDRAGHGWSQSYGVIPGVKMRFNHLCFLVQQGLDPNVPDAQGRIATIGAFANDTRHLTVDDLDWAFTRGADFLAVETPLHGPARSVLSINFSESPLADALIGEVQAHILSSLEALEDDLRTHALTTIEMAPVEPVHAVFWRELKHVHLARSLPSSPTLKPRSRF